MQKSLSAQFSLTKLSKAHFHTPHETAVTLGQSTGHSEPLLTLTRAGLMGPPAQHTGGHRLWARSLHV